MKKVFNLIIILILLSASSYAQHSKVAALTIDGKPVYKDELEREYKKNQSMIDSEYKESVESFLESYIYYRLNLEEAHRQKIDTTRAYRKELESYEIQLSNSYLKDTVSENKLTEQILKRFEEEVEVNHIFIPFDSTLTLPKDTVAYYQETLKTRALAIEKGFDKIDVGDVINIFEIILDVERQSGYLGWIRPFLLPIELEEIVYGLELNEVTMPIRVGNGYHVFQVIDRRPMQGNPIVEQVLFNFPSIPASKHIQDSVYRVAVSTHDEISIRDNFQMICDEFSLAFETGSRGCLLGELSIGAQAPLPLIQGAYQLREIGEVSKPILTAYGYHILRLKNKLKLPSKSKLTKTVKEALNSKTVVSKHSAMQLERLKTRNNVEVNKEAYDKLLKLTVNYNPNSPDFEDNVKHKSDILVFIDNKKDHYTVEDFLDYIALTSWLEQPVDNDPLLLTRLELMMQYTLSTDVLNDEFSSFLRAILSSYEKKTLAIREPKYASTISEISDGILHTILLENEIWRKSKTDVQGLSDTFNKNREKYTLGGEAFKGVVIHSKDEAILAKAEDEFEKNKLNSVELRNKYNNSGLVIQIDEGLWKKGDNPFVDATIYKKEEREGNRAFPYYKVIGEMISSPQDYTDVKAQVESDYQQTLEREWKSYLNNKYTVDVNQAVIKGIK